MISRLDIRSKINTKLLLLAILGAAMVISSYFLFVYEPLQILIKKVMTLSPGTIFYGVWQAPPYRVYINVYVFNVTNSEFFLQNPSSTKLKVEEVGPYCYRETLTNINPMYNDNGTVSFIPRRHLEFVRERSFGDPNVDTIITPNIPLVGITASLRDASMFTNLALSTISNVVNAKSFLNLTISEYLWGYDDRLVTLAHDAIPTWINFERFGIMDRIMALDNATNMVSITTSKDSKKPENPLFTEEEANRPYYIQDFNGSPGLHHWGYVDTKGNETNEANSRCNFVGGSFEGTIFPQNLTENDEFRLYRRAFCRPVPVKFDGYETINGHEGIRYRVREDFLATPEENPENACYCYNGVCLPKGLNSIAPCYYGIPITLSQPHFYNAAPFLTEQVEGLRPNKSLHDTSFVLHKELGVPLTANLRIQVNLDVGETQYNSRTRPFNGLHIPMCWLELQVDEIPTLLSFVSIMFYKILPVVQEMAKYLSAILGAALIATSALWFFFFLDDKDSIVNSPLDNLPFSRFSLRRSSEYRPLPVISIPSEYFNPEHRICK